MSWLIEKERKKRKAQLYQEWRYLKNRDEFILIRIGYPNTLMEEQSYCFDRKTIKCYIIMAIISGPPKDWNDFYIIYGCRSRLIYYCGCRYILVHPLSVNEILSAVITQRVGVSICIYILYLGPLPKGCLLFKALDNQIIPVGGIRDGKRPPRNARAFSLTYLI